VADIAHEIHEAIDAHLPIELELRAEPGRYVVAGGSAIATTVIGRETRNGIEWLYLDMGAFQGLIECLESPAWRYPIMRADNRASKSSLAFTVTGPSCDPADTLASGLLLPENTRVGDRLIIQMTGAYSLVYGSDFNGFPVPAVHVCHA
jgi:ornithine decarboxylase